jgi:DNA-directed RNA polymerase subunit RPC12/RpoP
MTKYVCVECGTGPIYDMSCTLERVDEPDDETPTVCPYKKGRKADFVEWKP